MTETTSANFAALARQIGRICREHQYQGPAFRAPPRAIGQDRTLRRVGTANGEGRVVVSVRLRDRAWADVRADMIEGTIAALELDGDVAARFAAILENATS